MLLPALKIVRKIYNGDTVVQTKEDVLPNVRLYSDGETLYTANMKMAVCSMSVVRELGLSE
jgi:hypothetical protein